MFDPSTIQFRPLFVSQRERPFPFRIRKALPESHRKFSPIACGKLQELRKRAGLHIAILSRPACCRNSIGRWFLRHDVPGFTQDPFGFVPLFVQRSNVRLQPRRLSISPAADGCKPR